jgi:WhiB family transcriptional regulator, redox-sensing transcriptional regulator
MTTHNQLIDTIREQHEGYTPCTEAPDLFFPPDEKLSYPAERQAKEICGGCPVAEMCLDYAITNNEHHGIWGGLSAKERSNLRRKEYAVKQRARRALTQRQNPMV